MSSRDIVRRIIMVVAAITVIALVNMLASLAISRSIAGNATAIGVAGSVQPGQSVGEASQPRSPLQESAEARVQRMERIQIGGTVVSVLIIAFLLVDTRRRIIRPLQRQGREEDSLARGDSSRRAQLESESQRKAQELERNNAVLELLHRNSRLLFASHNLCNGSVPMLLELEELLGVGPIRLFLHDQDNPEPVQAAVTASLERPFYCNDHGCNACLVSPEQYDSLPSEENNGRRLLLPIATLGQLLGTLEVWYPADKGLPAMSHRLLETLADQLATAVYLERQNTEEQQLTLSEERAVIARELHDSLAQSLTYLKMQVARLARLNIDGEQAALHADILQELSTGLNSAYRQLRELLGTFRLQLETQDLAAAVRQTVDEFIVRLQAPVDLHYDLPVRLLSPNEEIHTLQIIREALANVVKHARASEVEVRIDFPSPQVRVVIADNGVGLSGVDRPLQHYGMVIMQDRAHTLGGKLLYSNRDGGGVEITLTFIPHSRHIISASVAAG